MIRGTYIKNSISFALLAAMMCFLLIWGIDPGSVHLSVEEIDEILFRRTGETVSYRIVWDIRLPRILSAVVLDDVLSVSGFLLQTFFANPIAGPFVLGVSFDVKLVASLVTIILLGRGISIGSTGMVLTAFADSMISMGFILIISGKVKRMSMLVICGAMISYICSAITDFMATFAEDTNIVNLHNWSVGSFSGTSREDISVMMAMIFLSLVLVFLMTKPIGAYRMGEVYVQNMGVNILRLRVVLTLPSDILPAYATAFAGPMSFVGTAIPYLVKSLFETVRPIFMIPGYFLGSAVFCLFRGLAARTIFAPTELSISSMTAVFGAPVTIYMMVHNWKGMQ